MTRVARRLLRAYVCVSILAAPIVFWRMRDGGSPRYLLRSIRAREAPDAERLFDRLRTRTGLRLESVACYAEMLAALERTAQLEALMAGRAPMAASFDAAMPNEALSARVRSLVGDRGAAECRGSVCMIRAKPAGPVQTQGWDEFVLDNRELRGLIDQAEIHPVNKTILFRYQGGSQPSTGERIEAVLGSLSKLHLVETCTEAHKEKGSMTVAFSTGPEGPKVVSTGPLAGTPVGRCLTATMEEAFGRLATGIPGEAQRIRMVEIE